MVVSPPTSFLLTVNSVDDAPTSVVGNWVKELERFAPRLRVLLHHGPQRSRGNEFVRAAAAHDVIITSYALLRRDIDLLKKLRLNYAILDEAQNIKNPLSATASPQPA